MFRRWRTQNNPENESSEREAKVIRSLNLDIVKKKSVLCIYVCLSILVNMHAHTLLALYLQTEFSQYKQIGELRTALGPLSGRSLKFCSDACLKRYLVARNWNVNKAKKMLEETLKWRATYKPEETRWVSVRKIFKSWNTKCSINLTIEVFIYPSICPITNVFFMLTNNSLSCLHFTRHSPPTKPFHRQSFLASTLLLPFCVTRLW